MVIYSLLLIILMITRPQGLLGKTAAFKGWRGRKGAKARTQAEEVTAEDTSVDQSVAKATLGERPQETSLKKGEPE
jgi:Flp pilus assembly protein TadB